MVVTERKPGLADMARRAIIELQDPFLHTLTILIFAAWAQIADAGAMANYEVNKNFPGTTGIERGLKVQEVLETTQRHRSEGALVTAAAAFAVGSVVCYRQLKTQPTK